MNSISTIPREAPDRQGRNDTNWCHFELPSSDLSPLGDILQQTSPLHAGVNLSTIVDKASTTLSTNPALLPQEMGPMGPILPTEFLRKNSNPVFAQKLEERVCFTCGQSKPLTTEFFCTTTTGNGHFRRDCRKCFNRAKTASQQAKREEQKRVRAQMRSVIPQQRVCSCCQEQKPFTAEFFYRNKTARFGLTSTCQLCLQIKRANHYQRHRETILVKDRAYYERNRERVQERCRTNYQLKAAAQLGESLQDYLRRREERLERRQVRASFSLDASPLEAGSYHEITADPNGVDPLHEVMLYETMETLLFWVNDTLLPKEQDVLFAYADSLFNPQIVAATLHQPVTQVQSVIASIQQRAISTFGQNYASLGRAA